MMESHAILVTSQKGGVGKTTVAVNLAVALKLQGYRVLLVDADYSNPSVGFHLGMHEANVGFLSVVNGSASMESAVAIHNPTGVHVLPGEISSRVPEFSHDHTRRLNAELLKSKYDFIIIDTAPGPMPQETLKPFEEANILDALIVMTPEMSACASALRLVHTYNRLGVPHMVAVNKIRRRHYELGVEEIEDALGEGVIAALPEDDEVQASVASHIPVCLSKGKSPFSVSAKHLAARMINRAGLPASAEETKKPNRSFLSFFRNLLKLR